MNVKQTKKVIERIMNHYSVSPEEFSERTGLKLFRINSVINETINLYRNDKMLICVAFPEVSPQWIMWGKAPFLADNTQERISPDKLKINITIEEFTISLTINGDDEKMYRDAAKLLKSRLAQNKPKFPNYSKERLLRLTGFDFAKEFFKNQHLLESGGKSNLEIPVTMSAGRLFAKEKKLFSDKFPNKSSEMIYLFAAYGLAVKVQASNNRLKQECIKENIHLKSNTMKSKNVRFSAYKLFNQEKEKEIWTVISEKDDIDWTTEFIEKNKMKLNWKALSFNDSLPWSMDLIARFEAYWDWHALSYIIAGNHIDRFEFDMLLKQYKMKIDWKVICQGTNIKHSDIEKYSEFINWDSISSNNRFVWDEDFISKHINDINWKVFTECLATKATPSVMQTAFRKKALDMYSDKLDFGLLSENASLEFTFEIIEKYKDRWNWAELINNPSIKWGELMLQEFDEYISTVKPKDLMVSYMWTSIMEDGMKIKVMLALL